MMATFDPDTWRKTLNAHATAGAPQTSDWPDVVRVTGRDAWRIELLVSGTLCAARAGQWDEVFARLSQSSKRAAQTPESLGRMIEQRYPEVRRVERVDPIRQFSTTPDGLAVTVCMHLTGGQSVRVRWLIDRENGHWVSRGYRPISQQAAVAA
jgi:hypothetical protein